MIRARADPAKNINTAAAEKHKDAAAEKHKDIVDITGITAI